MNDQRVTRRKLFKLGAVGAGSLAVASTAGIAPQRAIAQANTITPDKLKAAITELEKLLAAAMTKSGVPGVSIGIVFKDVVVYLKGFGVREVGKPDAVDVGHRLSARLDLQANLWHGCGRAGRRGQGQLR